MTIPILSLANGSNLQLGICAGLPGASVVGTIMRAPGATVEETSTVCVPRIFVFRREEEQFEARERNGSLRIVDVGDARIVTAITMNEERSKNPDVRRGYISNADTGSALRERRESG